MQSAAISMSRALNQDVVEEGVNVNALAVHVGYKNDQHLCEDPWNLRQTKWKGPIFNVIAHCTQCRIPIKICSIDICKAFD